MSGINNTNNSFVNNMRAIIQNEDYCKRTKNLEDGKLLKAVYGDLFPDCQEDLVLIDRASGAGIAKIIKEEKDCEVAFNKCMNKLIEKELITEENALKVVGGYRFLCEDNGQTFARLMAEQYKSKNESRSNEGTGNKTTNNIPVNNMPMNNMPVNNTPANNMPMNNMPVNNTPVNNMPVNNMPENNMPVNSMPVNNVPVNNVPVNNVPVNDVSGNTVYTASKGKKKYVNKVAYCLLALFLGWLGIHKFYSGRIGMGILYILVCWTYVPAVISFIEFLIALTKKADENGKILI